MRRSPIQLLCIALLCAAFLSPAARPGAQAPAWFLKHLQEQMQHGGRTIADNGEYMGPGEPADAYGIEWKWGLGKQSISGRLYGLVDGVEQGDAWQMRSYWHPGMGQVRALQFGADGTLSEGWMKPGKDGGTELEQVFFYPDGSRAEVRHENSAFFDGEHEGSSFRRVNGAWEANRSYVWLVDKSAPKKQR